MTPLKIFAPPKLLNRPGTQIFYLALHRCHFKFISLGYVLFFTKKSPPLTINKNDDEGCVALLGGGGVVEIFGLI